MSPKGLVLFGAALGATTIVAVAAGDGSVAVAIAPALLFAVLYATWKLPLRWPLLVLTFCALTLENPADVPAMGLWKSPLYTVGALLLAHMNVTLPYRALLFSGLDLVLLYLGIVVAARVLTRTRIDGGAMPGAKPMRTFILIALGGVTWMWIYGVAVGGADVASSLWQVQRVMYLPIIALLYLYALRGPRDYIALGKVLVAAACLKACVAFYVSATVPPPTGKPALEYATTHPDSMLFANAACLVVIMLLQRQDRKRTIASFAVLALLIAGMIINNRRLVWVEVGVGLLLVFSLARRTRLKDRIVRGLALSSPATLGYCVLGWGSYSSVFRPVQVIRSVVDSSSDMSTLWRDLENYDICYTIGKNPVFGTGYGHGYIEIIKLPDVTSTYALERFIPHNAVLGLWAYGGLVGFTALWTMFPVGIFFAARANRWAKDAPSRVASLGAIIAIVIYLVHCWGDMGLGTWVGVFTTAPALAVAAKLAVATGAWSDVRVRRAIPVVATAKEVVV